MAFVTPLIDIFGISLFLVIASKIMQSKLMDKKGMEETQKNVKKKSAKMKELLKKKDEKSVKEAEKLQTEILEMSQEMMQGTMKYMMFSLPLFLVVFAFLGGTYGEDVIDLPIPLPWWFDAIIWNPLTWFNVKLYSQTNWFGWYFASYLSVSIVAGIGKKILKKFRGED